MTSYSNIPAPLGPMATVGDELEQRLEQIFAAVAPRLEDEFGDQALRRVVAAEITKLVIEGFNYEQLLTLFADVRQVGKKDEIKVRRRRGMRAYWTARGAAVKSSDQDERVWRLERDMIGYAIDELIEKMTAGFSYEAAELIRGAIAQLLGEINRRFFELVLELTDDSTPYYEEGAGVSLEWIRSQLTAIKDKARTGGTSGMIIAGRATMTDQLLNILEDDNKFIPETNEDIVRRGLLGTYRGARILEWTNYEDAHGGPRIPANELVIIGPDSSIVGFWGGMQSFEEIDGEYWKHWAKREVGMAVWQPDRLRRFHDTSINAIDGEPVSA
jgi:hypothetical protein